LVFNQPETKLIKNIIPIFQE